MLSDDGEDFESPICVSHCEKWLLSTNLVTQQCRIANLPKTKVSL
jgi:hypothetical protein